MNWKVILCSFIFSNITLCQNVIKFDNYFTKIGEITIPDDFIIGAISYIDVFNDYKYIITDPVSRKVIYLDYKSKQAKLLNPVICTPGFKLNSDYARFNKSGEIYVMNNFGVGYIFDQQGNCRQPLENNYYFPHIAFLNSGEIVAYSNMGDRNHLKLMSSVGKELYRFGKFEKISEKTIQKFMGGGLVVDNNDLIYQMNCNSSEIFVYKGTRLIKTLDSHIKNFDGYNLELKKYDDLKSNIDQYKKILDNYSFIVALFLYDKNSLFIVFNSRHKFYGQLLSVDGQNYIDKPIEFKKPPVFCKNGFLYLVEQPEPIGDQLPNPKILIYRINMEY